MKSAKFILDFFPLWTELAATAPLGHDPSMLDLIRRPELLTPSQMGAADRWAMDSGVPGLVLMENAGAAVAREAARMARSRGRIDVLCGPGGNGGDGFVAARLLNGWGYRVRVFLLGDRAASRADAAEMAARLDAPLLAAKDFDPRGADLVIDALYGAGLARDIDAQARICVERINAFAAGGGAVLAVDVPSGIEGETGAVRGVAVRATASVTFFRLKPGHLLLPGREFAGRVVLADIGIPRNALDAIAPLAFANTPALWSDALPRLTASSHKYTRGSALVLSGAAHRTGAARLAARAALRVGAGLVTLASPLDAVAVNSAHLTAIMIEPFDGLVGFSALLADSRRNAVLLGPAAGVGEATRALAGAALTTPSEKPRAVVIDADAISSFAGDAAGLTSLIAERGHATVLTPHEGEFARLFRGRADVLALPSKLARARAAAATLGADSVAPAPAGRACGGCDLPPPRATAGSGDTLAGFVTGLLAQGMAPFEAASAAVWLHGACARALGPGLIAEDLADALPAALRELPQTT